MNKLLVLILIAILFVACGLKNPTSNAGNIDTVYVYEKDTICINYVYDNVYSIQINEIMSSGYFNVNSYYSLNDNGLQNIKSTLYTSSDRYNIYCFNAYKNDTLKIRVSLTDGLDTVIIINKDMLINISINNNSVFFEIKS